ncbi:MAG: 5-formyltetrahydrofolate cyclo-ligase [Nanoarchaeota archaeon]
MKYELRAKLLGIRDSMPDKERAEKSRQITERLKALTLFQEAKSILLYYSIQSEVNTRELIAELAGKKLVYLPFTKQHVLGWAKVTSIKDLKPGAFNIPEPRQDQAPPPDLVVLPGVGFDTTGNRLGRGKGFYDRTLSSIKAPTIALAFDCQIIDHVPHNRRDIPIDIVITETRLIRRPA